MKIRKLTAAMLCLVVLSGCSSGSDETSIIETGKTIKIAVFRNSRSQQVYFEKGVERAYKDVLEEYKDSGFDIQCDFYDNSESYENVDKLTKELVQDKQLTAIIGSDKPETAKDQLYITQKRGKILISPGRMYDDELTADNDMSFYMSCGTKEMGELMKKISEKFPNVNWAVCTANDKISRYETQVFRAADTSNVVDYVSVEDLSVYFDRITERWESLNVRGVVISPRSNEGFELVYKLKTKMPDLCIISDTDMDNQQEYEEHKEMYNNFYIADSFSVDKSEAAYIEYTEKNGKFEDTWETHGYNTLRMIVDTAVQNDTTSPVKIASLIHTSGYKGKGEDFKFEKNGVLIPESFRYIDMGKLEEGELPVK
ncbi:MAG: amino acid ABC transporter substrate-binding protein [Firmicutes bacterium]|nr:amino acid ABC transporter substrate-binding protein [Bacillota bacterium]MBQ9604848.1 amino acid ABC transporter substrate-binding protein [Bacillota bacterium]